MPQVFRRARRWLGEPEIRRPVRLATALLKPGTVSCTVGTSGVVFAFLAEPAYDSAGRVHTFCHAVPGAWHVMGVTQAAGLSLQWFRNRFAPDSTYEDLIGQAARSSAGAQGLFWLPYLMGERTPHLDANARGAWIGLTAKHQRADLVRAILEGVCYSQKEALEIIAHLGARPSSVRLSGGGAKSAFWHATVRGYTQSTRRYSRDAGRFSLRRRAACDDRHGRV